MFYFLIKIIFYYISIIGIFGLLAGFYLSCKYIDNYQNKKKLINDEPFNIYNTIKITVLITLISGIISILFSHFIPIIIITNIINKLKNNKN